MIDNNIALEQKGPGISQPVIEACRRLTSEREHIHQLKVTRMNIPRSSLRTDDIVNSLNYEGIAVIELQFYSLSWTVTDCVLALSQTK